MDRVILDIDQIGKRQDKIWGNYPPNGNLPGSQYQVKPLSIVSTELLGLFNCGIKIDNMPTETPGEAATKSELCSRS